MNQIFNFIFFRAGDSAGQGNRLRIVAHTGTNRAGQLWHCIKGTSYLVPSFLTSLTSSPSTCRAGVMARPARCSEEAALPIVERETAAELQVGARNPDVIYIPLLPPSKSLAVH